MPFSNVDSAARYRERQVPTRHEDRVEMATTLLADPTVVEGVLDTPAPARSEMRIAIARRDSEQREAQRERNEQRRADEAMPLPAHIATMARKIDEWAL